MADEHGDGDEEAEEVEALLGRDGARQPLELLEKLPSTAQSALRCEREDEPKRRSGQCSREGSNAAAACACAGSAGRTARRKTPRVLWHSCARFWDDAR
eukprot:3937450-Rhodomonas_salina.2